MRPDLSKISSASVRAFVRRNPYRAYGRPSMAVEKLFLETATQVDVFYELCNGSSRPPTQQEFIKKYLDLCKSEMSQKGGSPEEFGKRIARAWASYIMELDFYCQLRDSGLFDQVTIDTELNAKKGYDNEVIYKGKAHYVHFSYLTEYEREWVKVKARRKAGVPKALDFYLEQDEADFIGNVHFYASQHVEKLLQELKEQIED